MTAVGSSRWIIATSRALAEAIADMSHDEIRSALQDALAEVGTDGEGWPPFVREVFEAEVVYEWGGKLWRAGYAIDDASNVELGEGRQVRIAYVDVAADPAAEPASEAVDFSKRAAREALVRALDTDHGFRAEMRAVLGKLEEAEPTPLVDLVEAAPAGTLSEAAVRSDGTALLKLIGPGWGSSGYYGAEMLERDLPAAFPAGTKGYWNHPTRTEERERPEGDLDTLAHELLEDAKFLAGGPEGPGGYARAKVFGPFRERVEELAPHIGMSIRAEGRVAPGTAEGKTGPIVQTLERGLSVDFVTVPGAKGQVVEMFEGAGRTARPIDDEEGTVTDELKEAQDRAEAAETARREAEERAQRAETAAAIVGAREAARTAIADKAFDKLPVALKDRVVETVASNPPMKDGALDGEALAAKVKEAAEAERAYLARIAGRTEVSGLGESAQDDPDPDVRESRSEAERDEETDELFESIADAVPTLSDDGRKAFVEGRGRRRGARV